MRWFFATTFVLAFCQSALSTQEQRDVESRMFEQTIIDTFECIRGEMNQGWEEEWGIPHFNPLIIAELLLNLDSTGIEGVSGNLLVQNTSYDGLNKFVLSNVEGSIGLLPPAYNCRFTLTFEENLFSTKYDIDLKSLELDLFGKGILRFDVTNFEVRITLRAVILGGIRLDYFTFLPSLEAVNDFEVTGVYNDEVYSEQLTQNVLQNGPQIVDNLAETIDQHVGETMVNLINNGGGDENGFFVYLIDKCLGGSH